MANLNGDFNRGLCHCGNSLFRLAAKYAIAKLVKSGDKAPLMWQWYCNGCGAVHHEPCEIFEHNHKV